VCASQLRWGLASYESAGCLSQGTVILAQQNQQLQQSQHASTAWATQRGQGGLNSQARIGSGLSTQAGLGGGLNAQAGYNSGFNAQAGLSGGLDAQAGYSSGFNTQAGYSSTQTSYSSVQEVATSTHSSFGTSGFIGTTLFTTDIPRFIPNMMPTAPAPAPVAVAEEGLKRKLAYAFFIVKLCYTPDRP